MLSSTAQVQITGRGNLISPLGGCRGAGEGRGREREGEVERADIGNGVREEGP